MGPKTIFVLYKHDRLLLFCLENQTAVRPWAAPAVQSERGKFYCWKLMGTCSVPHSCRRQWYELCIAIGQACGLLGPIAYMTSGIHVDFMRLHV